MPCLDFDIVFSYKMSFTVILNSHMKRWDFRETRVDQAKSCLHLRYIRIKEYILTLFQSGCSDSE